MRKLSDLQLIILSSAAARDDGAAILPQTITKEAAAKLATSLAGRKLMREVKSQRGMPVWRVDRARRPFGLVITQTGRDAIGVIEDTAGMEKDRAGSASIGSIAAGRPDPHSGQTLGSETIDKMPPRSPRKARRAEATDGEASANRSHAARTVGSVSDAAAVPTLRPGSKQALILDMLSKKEGATLAALIAATGWLPHTTRAALTGLRKRGYAVERARDGDGGPSVYRATGSGATRGNVAAA